MSQFNPAPSSGGSSNSFGIEKRIVRYVHSGNKVIQPDSVDLATGIFTTLTPMNIVAGTTVPFVLNYQSYPNQLFAEWNGANTNKIKTIDATTFQILNGTTPLTYASTVPNNSISFNLSTISFEYDISQPIIDLTGLDVGDELRIINSGTRDRAGWSTVQLWFDYTGGTANNTGSINMVDGRDFMSFYQEAVYKYYRESGLLITHGGRNIKREWNGGTAWVFTSTLDPTRNFYKYYNIKFTSLRPIYNMSNGSVVELYSIKGVQ
jgi:hypothetical protein